MTNQSPAIAVPAPHLEPRFMHRWPGYFARVVIALVALWAMQFTTVRDPGHVDVQDYHPCVTGAEALAFRGSCDYKVDGARGDPMSQTFILKLTNGAEMRVRHVEPISEGGTIPTEHNTVATWALATVVLVAVFFGSVTTAVQWACEKIAPKSFIDRDVTIPYRLQLVALVVLLVGTAVYFYPSAREAIAMHRINAMEDRLRADQTSAENWFVSTTEGGDLYALGNDGIDQALKQAGYGCRFYADDGQLVTLAPATKHAPIKRSALPPRYRSAGLCLLPEYSRVLVKPSL
jgi:hypothetical protein